MMMSSFFIRLAYRSSGQVPLTLSQRPALSFRNIAPRGSAALMPPIAFLIAAVPVSSRLPSSAHQPDLGLIPELRAEDVTCPVRPKAVSRVEATGPAVGLENP